MIDFIDLFYWLIDLIYLFYWLIWLIDLIYWLISFWNDNYTHYKFWSLFLAERNLALETAEKIQRSYEELQSKFKKTLSSSEEETNTLHKERAQLHEDLEGRCSQVKTLQEDIKNLRAEINAQKNVRRENEQRNTDLRSQMKNQSAKIEKLEQDLENHKKFKVWTSYHFVLSLTVCLSCATGLLKLVGENIFAF